MMFAVLLVLTLLSVWTDTNHLPQDRLTVTFFTVPGAGGPLR